MSILNKAATVEKQLQWTTKLVHTFMPKIHYFNLWRIIVTDFRFSTDLLPANLL